MFWRFCRTKPFIDSYSTSRDRRSNASPLFFGSPLMYMRKNGLFITSDPALGLPYYWHPFTVESKDPYFWCHKVCHEVFDTVKTSAL